MLVALFSLLMATDAVTLGSIFKHFMLPGKLEIYGEGESLFNDVTALILFYFIALPLVGGEKVVLTRLPLVLLGVLFFSIAIGIVIAAAGYLAIKLLRDPIEEFIIIYLVA